MTGGWEGVGGGVASTPTRKSPTPAGCPKIQPSSEAVYLEMVPDSTG